MRSENLKRRGCFNRQGSSICPGAPPRNWECSAREGPGSGYKSWNGAPTKPNLTGRKVDQTKWNQLTNVRKTLPHKSTISVCLHAAPCQMKRPMKYLQMNEDTHCQVPIKVMLPYSTHLFKTADKGPSLLRPAGIRVQSQGCQVGPQRLIGPHGWSRRRPAAPLIAFPLGPFRETGSRRKKVGNRAALNDK